MAKPARVCVNFACRAQVVPRRPRGRGADLAVEVEVLRRTLLEPQSVVVGRVLKELRRLLEHVVVFAARLSVVIL